MYRKFFCGKASWLYCNIVKLLMMRLHKRISTHCEPLISLGKLGKSLHSTSSGLSKFSKSKISDLTPSMAGLPVTIRTLVPRRKTQSFNISLEF